jgi:hypothetical protein
MPGKRVGDDDGQASPVRPRLAGPAILSDAYGISGDTSDFRLPVLADYRFFKATREPV